MTRPLHYLSVCAGIEAATVAWHDLGWRPIAFSEIEPFPSAVLKHRYPEVPNLGDMTKFELWPHRCECPEHDDYAPRQFSIGNLTFKIYACTKCGGITIDVLVGGTPCQSFSVAGLRLGLDDPRGNLALVYLALARRYRPRWMVWENVPGVHSSWSDVAVRAPSALSREICGAVDRDLSALGLDGIAAAGLGAFEEADQSNDFDVLLAGMAELGFGVCTRVLDAQFFGVAQRRRRVFAVGHLGAWQPAAAVLFEPESLRGDSAPSRVTGERPAGTLTRGALDGSSPTGGDGREGLLITGGDKLNPETVSTITAKSEGGSAGQDALGQIVLVDSVARALPSERGQRNNGTEQNLVVAFSATDAGRDASVDISPTLRACPHRDSHANSGHVVAIAIQERATSENPNAGPQGKGIQEDLAYTLEARRLPQAVAFKPAHYTRGKDGAPAEITPPLTAEADKGDEDPIVFQPRIGRNDRGQPSAIVPALNGADSGETSDSRPVVCVDMGAGKGGARTKVAEEKSPALSAEGAAHAIGGTGSHVRRLTPVECERLQGFPDNYTLIPGEYNRIRDADDLAETVAYLEAHGLSKAEALEIAQAPDGPRYKALGNSMATPVMKWIGTRIDTVNEVVRWEPAL